MVRGHMRNLAKELEISDIPSPDPGVYEFPLGADRQVTIQELPPGVYLFSDLGPCPRQRREELFTLLMMSNLFGFGTEHAVLGLDRRGENCTLSLAVKDATEYRVFRDHLEEFVNQVDFWADEIDNYREDG